MDKKRKDFSSLFFTAFSADELLFDKEIAESLFMTRQIQIKLNEKRSKDFFIVKRQQQQVVIIKMCILVSLLCVISEIPIKRLNLVQKVIIKMLNL